MRCGFSANGVRAVAQRDARDETGPQERNGDRRPVPRPATEEDEGLRARLDRLSAALDAQTAEAGSRQKRAREKQHSSGTGQALTLGMRVLSEFLAAVLVGSLIGWGIDELAGTRPAFLIIFLLLGAAAGSWNVYRLAMQPLPGKKG